MRVEPYVIPKRSLTGDNTERVDTRVLQVIYQIDNPGQQFYVGQQLDVFIDSPKEAGEKQLAGVPDAAKGEKVQGRRPIAPVRRRASRAMRPGGGPSRGGGLCRGTATRNGVRALGGAGLLQGLGSSCPCVITSRSTIGLVGRSAGRWPTPESSHFPKPASTCLITRE